jgi:hypothetical protein
MDEKYPSLAMWRSLDSKGKARDGSRRSFCDVAAEWGEKMEVTHSLNVGSLMLPKFTFDWQRRAWHLRRLTTLWSVAGRAERFLRHVGVGFFNSQLQFVADASHDKIVTTRRVRLFACDRADEQASHNSKPGTKRRAQA